MFLRNRIHNEVMSVVKARIAAAQQEYDEKSKALKQESVERIRQLKAELKAEHDNLALSLVQSIIGKFM